MADERRGGIQWTDIAKQWWTLPENNRIRLLRKAIRDQADTFCAEIVTAKRTIKREWEIDFLRANRMRGANG